MKLFSDLIRFLSALFYKKRPGKKQPTILPEPEPPIEKRPGVFLWILDNGHGKKTRGKRSPKLPNGKRFFEWEYNRIIVNLTAKALDKLGFSYHILVPETDCGDILKERTRRANDLKSDLPKIFLSIHFNAATSKNGTGWTRANGIETWFKFGSSTSEFFAKIFQKHLLTQTGFRNRGIKSKAIKQFYVLRKTDMPAILTENGFMNNKVEVKKLMKLEMIEAIVKAHVKAIAEIENSTYTEQYLEKAIKLAVVELDGDKSRD